MSQIEFGQTALAEELVWTLRNSRARRLRTMEEFAEQEIVIPDGKHAGWPYLIDRQPFARLFFRAVDSHRYNRIVATGPSQSGKTLTCWAIPILYHLFEIGEKVLGALPHMEMAADKWREDLLPVIERTRYRRLLPRTGGGSRGGSKCESMAFGNGSTLRFMTGGGGDKQRSGYTTRVVVITETDGMDESGGASREADKIAQLEARTESYGDESIIYMECTVSTELGLTWREIQAGTQSRIVLPCPHCREWVSPEREHLRGWKDAESSEEAAARSAFHCPLCEEAWTEAQRAEANRNAALIHRGQEARRNRRDLNTPIIEGDHPPTSTLGFRYSAVNNLFTTAARLGRKEWQSAREEDQENAEKELRQFFWALPYIPDVENVSNLTAYGVARRGADAKPAQGVVPEETDFLGMAIDVGKWKCHWTLIAGLSNRRLHIVDYGILRVDSDAFETDIAVLTALREAREWIEVGWPWSGEKPFVPQQVWIDANWMEAAVRAFCLESGPRYRSTMGHGATQATMRSYTQPRQKSKHVRTIGEQYFIQRVEGTRTKLVHWNTDYWKSWLHRRLGAAPDAEGAMSFYAGHDKSHLHFTRHLLAEREVEKYDKTKGVVRVFERVSKENHYLDSTAMACAALHFCGFRLMARESVTTDRPAQPEQPRRALAHSAWGGFSGGIASLGNEPFVSQRP